MTTAGRYLGLFGTAVKLAQLVPVALGLAIVFFSPSAWLSGTLRRWAVGGVIAGAALGMASLAAARARIDDEEGFGGGLLLMALVATAVLRFHLALVDLTFLESWPFLRPLHDFYLGSDLGERLYNVTTAVWFGLAVLLATWGLPLHVRGRAARRSAEGEPTAAAGADGARAALTTLSAAIDALEASNAKLREENERLRSEAAERRATAGPPRRNDPPPAGEADPR